MVLLFQNSTVLLQSSPNLVRSVTAKPHSWHQLVLVRIVNAAMKHHHQTIQSMTLVFSMNPYQVTYALSGHLSASFFSTCNLCQARPFFFWGRGFPLLCAVFNTVNHHLFLVQSLQGPWAGSGDPVLVSASSKLVPQPHPSDECLSSLNSTAERNEQYKILLKCLSEI